jgi:PEP-CTERM motif
MSNFRIAIIPLALCLSSPAAAEIATINFSGKGYITYSDYDFVPPVGSPVTVSGRFDLGDFTLPDRYTGGFVLDQIREGQAFSYGVDGANISGAQDGVYRAAGGTLLRGRLVGLYMYADYDSEFSELNTNGFSAVTGFHSSDGILHSWGGKWAMVPEPSSWAMMLAGFAAAGAMIRRRKTGAALPA